MRRFPETIAERLFAEGYGFDFFQAVRLLERLSPECRPVGRDAAPALEAVRFRAHLSLSFPPSAIYKVEHPTADLPLPVMTVAFLGLTGPSGILPRHYTEQLFRARDAKGPERWVLRDWFDLFNHRLLSLFYRAWVKYRFWLAYERGEHTPAEPDLFTQALFSLIGLGSPALRNRLRVSTAELVNGRSRERVLARVSDLVLLHYSGLLAQRRRSAVALEGILEDYFGLPVRVEQFQGQWLRLAPHDRTRLSGEGSYNQLGVDAVAGECVWDVQSKIRIRLGPLRYGQFVALLPDRTPLPSAKLFFELLHLVRFYAGPEFDVDVQLVLKRDEVPACRLCQAAADGPRLGWNTWLTSLPMPADPEEAVFEGEEVVWLDRKPPATPLP